MCRNIKVLYHFEPPASADEIRAAALQYVRKISGFSKPSQANQAAFDAAVEAAPAAPRRLIQSLETYAPPRDPAGGEVRPLQQFAGPTVDDHGDEKKPSPRQLLPLLQHDLGDVRPAALPRSGSGTGPAARSAPLWHDVIEPS